MQVNKSFVDQILKLIKDQPNSKEFTKLLTRILDNLYSSAYNAGYIHGADEYMS